MKIYNKSGKLIIEVEGNLRCANLFGANLFGANLCNVDLRNSNLRNSNLRNSNLRNSNLRNSDLRNVNLRDANLSGANLSGANLCNANLWGCIGNQREIKTHQCGQYIVNYTKNILWLGCRGYTLEQRLNFTDGEILPMAEDALEYVRKWLPTIQKLIEMDPAE